MIDECMVELLSELDLKTVQVNETEIIEECARRVGEKQLLDLSEEELKREILTALEKSPLFQKTYRRPEKDDQNLSKCYLVV
ncbi:MAG: hypothetical protein D6B28_08355 [Gammaproteobacteria bacterium]|nr:MAG: hypothetical protein D6B28_08355 [Gammaproteobacteria bacterium]